MQDLTTLLSDLKSFMSDEQLIESRRLQLTIRKGHILIAIKASVSHGRNRLTKYIPE